jgi:hypothetical protein
MQKPELLTFYCPCDGLIPSSMLTANCSMASDMPKRPQESRQKTVLSDRHDDLDIKHRKKPNLRVKSEETDT